MSNEDKYDIIAMDITSNCNLRCLFCFNDFSSVRGNVLMDEETYEKALTLLPLANEEKFLISCLYEPTLHPDFAKYLKKVPEGHRGKVIFTTNLAKRMSDDFFRELSEIRIHHINISLDSFDPAVFERLRRGAKFDIFMDNLERLTNIFSNNSTHPPLRYITTVLKSNINEVPEILERCHRKYTAYESEFRPPWTVPVNREFLMQEYVSPEEWREVDRKLMHLGYRYHAYVFPPVSGDPGEKEHAEPRDEPERGRLYVVPSQTGLRIHSDGSVEFLERDVSTSLIYMKDPYKVFRDILPILQMDAARGEELQRLTHSGQLPSIPSEVDFFITAMKRLKNNPFAKAFYKIVVRPVLRFFIRVSSRTY